MKSRSVPIFKVKWSRKLWDPFRTLSLIIGFCSPPVICAQRYSRHPSTPTSSGLRGFETLVRLDEGLTAETVKVDILGPVRDSEEPMSQRRRRVTPTIMTGVLTTLLTLSSSYTSRVV